MNRVRLGAAILLMLLVLSIGTAWFVHTETDKLLAGLDEIEEIAETQSLEAAAEPFAEFEVQWEKSQRMLNLMVWRDKVLQIDITISHLDPMRAEDCDELKSEFAEARMWIERLGVGEMPLLRNIL